MVRFWILSSLLTDDIEDGRQTTGQCPKIYLSIIKYGMRLFAALLIK